MNSKKDKGCIRRILAVILTVFMILEAGAIPAAASWENWGGGWTPSNDDSQQQGEAFELEITEEVEPVGAGEAYYLQTTSSQCSASYSYSYDGKTGDRGCKCAPGTLVEVTIDVTPKAGYQFDRVEIRDSWSSTVGFDLSQSAGLTKVAGKEMTWQFTMPDVSFAVLHVICVPIPPKPVVELIAHSTKLEYDTNISILQAKVTDENTGEVLKDGTVQFYRGENEKIGEPVAYEDNFNWTGLSGYCCQMRSYVHENYPFLNMGENKFYAVYTPKGSASEVRSNEATVTVVKNDVSDDAFSTSRPLNPVYKGKDDRLEVSFMFLHSWAEKISLDQVEVSCEKDGQPYSDIIVERTKTSVKIRVWEVGSYIFTANISQANPHYKGSDEITLTISPRAITVKPMEATMAIGGSPALECQIGGKGLGAGDSLSNVSYEINGGKPYNQEGDYTAAVQSYDLTNADQYEVTMETGILHVRQAEIDYKNETISPVGESGDFEYAWSRDAKTWMPFTEPVSITEHIPEAGEAAAAFYFREKNSLAAEVAIPARPSAPPAPIARQLTETSVTLDSGSTDMEYRCGEGQWQASPVFEGLVPGSAARFSQRMAATEHSFVSAASAEKAYVVSKVPIRLKITSNKAEGITYGDTVVIKAEAAKGEGQEAYPLSGSLQFYLDGRDAAHMIGNAKPVTASGDTASVSLDYKKLTAGTHTVYCVFIGDENQSFQAPQAPAERQLQVAKKQLTWNTEDLTAAKSDGETGEALVYGKLKVNGSLEDEVEVTAVDLLTKGMASITQPGDYPDIPVEGTISLGSAEVMKNYLEPKELPKLTARVHKVNALPNPPEDTDVLYKLEMEHGISSIPDALKNLEAVNTPSKLEKQMKLSIAGQSSSIEEHDMAVYDVVLLVSTDNGKTWTKADVSNFPAGGLSVTLPYPQGTGQYTHQFTAVHMFTSTAFGKTPGDIETPDAVNTGQGIRMVVTGLSPIALGWQERSGGGSIVAGDPVEVDIPITVKTDAQGKSEASVTDEQVRQAVAKGEKEAAEKGTPGCGLILNVVPAAAEASGELLIRFPKSVQKQIQEHNVRKLTAESPAAALTLEADALNQIYRESGEEMLISLKEPVRLDYKAETKAAVNGRPVVVACVLGADGKPIEHPGSAWLSIPYTLGEGETAEEIQGVSIDGSGRLQWLTGAVYDAKSQQLRLAVTLPGCYGVGNINGALTLSPVSVKLEKKTQHEVQISWKALKDAEGYTLWTRQEGETSYTRRAIRKTGDALTYTWRNCKPGTKHYFVVKAWVKDGQEKYFFGNASKTVRGTTKPETAQIRAVKGNASGDLKVYLEKAAAGADRYAMCWSKRADFSRYAIGIRTRYTTRTMAHDLKRGRYYVKVRSYRQLAGSRVYGDWSQAVAVDIK